MVGPPNTAPADESSAPTRRTGRQPQQHSHNHELDALYKITPILGPGTKQRQMLEDVLDVLASDLGMTRGTVTLLSADGSELMIEVAHNLSAKLHNGIRYRMGEGITGRVVQTGKPAIVPKVSQDPPFLDKIHRRRKLAKDEISFICVPIAIGRDVVGALSADRVFDESAALEEDVRLLTIVASMIANDVEARRAAAAQRQVLEEVFRYKIKKLGIDYRRFRGTRMGEAAAPVRRTEPKP